MRHAGLDEAQAAVKIAGGNINNLRCAEDTTLMAESEEYNQSDFGVDHLVVSMCRVISCVVGRGCLL